MLLKILRTVLFLAFSLQVVACLPMKRSIFELKPFGVHILPKIPMDNHYTRQQPQTLFTVPDFQAPFQLLRNIYHNNNDKQRIDDSRPDLFLNNNNHVQVTYKVHNKQNQENNEVSTYQVVKNTTPAIMKPTKEDSTSIVKNKFENEWDDIFKSNEIFDNSTSELTTETTSDTTESTTEFETTTIADLLNRMAVPPQVVASLVG